MNRERERRTFAEQEVDGEVDHVRGHGAEGEDDDEPDDARQHAVVDRPVRDLVQELVRNVHESKDGERVKENGETAYRIKARHRGSYR